MRTVKSPFTVNLWGKGRLILFSVLSLLFSPDSVQDPTASTVYSILVTFLSCKFTAIFIWLRVCCSVSLAADVHLSLFVIPNNHFTTAWAPIKIQMVPLLRVAVAVYHSSQQVLRTEQPYRSLVPSTLDP